MESSDRSSPPPEERPAYRPPIGIPTEPPARWAIPVSVGVHVLLVLLLVLASIVSSRSVIEAIRGAGGAGPAGGGGGAGGGQSVQERLRYIQIAPPAPAPSAAKSVVVPRAVPPPKHEPKVPRPHIEQPVVRVPKPAAPPVDVRVKAPDPPQTLALSTGPGAGPGTNGTGGQGPGTGGGVGTGAGTGRGSAAGPGTGGGAGTIYPPTPDFLLIPPQPEPDKVRGKSIRIVFIIDAQGKPQRVEFESTGDSGYDRLLREKLSEFRFRPAHRMDGTPVPSRYEAQVRL